ncbi:hypothetical protein DW220_00070 [Eubacterium sp. AM18-26]|uniref:Uncharacterized protein n=1 Tax=Amedibacterium intestinale TaxID=2583452 RepID=A0A6N4TIV5_9FIRM|nr:hypothetical protein [Amedibacterium intestinale]RHO24547.1 hypothetical protein DW220_00070 [Eubacterium sp. AM18-26]BBK22679.1 hypothetical protein Aargi30884_15820 [Amedibacterium intestinale]
MKIYQKLRKLKLKRWKTLNLVLVLLLFIICISIISTLIFLLSNILYDLYRHNGITYKQCMEIITRVFMIFGGVVVLGILFQND